MRHPTPDPPAEVGHADGLAYTLWLPEGEPRGGMVILHGAGSRKENHHDMARAARGAGLAAVCFDMRGHGDSEGELDARMITDVATIAALLPPGPLALRGSSMGGYVALQAADHVGAAAVVAICPAGADLLARSLRAGRYDFRARVGALEAFLAEHDLPAAVDVLGVPVLLLHAEGDEQVPVADTRALARRCRAPQSKLVVLPGGHHRSIQHDPELQGLALRWAVRAMRGR